MSKAHLGGHLNITHIDEGCLKFVMNQYGAKTMLDIGCGPGGQVQLANNLGFEKSIGIDGFPGPKRCKNVEIIIHDFTKGPYDHDGQIYDLGWSCEFVEHVYEKYIPNFMNSYKSCKHLIITYAPPGKAGHHHVNCRKEQYWIDKFNENGFLFDQEVTKEIRNLSTMKNNLIRNHGLFFINKGI